ncbi:hypothetical protein JAB4_059510 (plasmid) [Janthinobacterium sp. HH102]|uniref:DUF932 domain-containing protein n=1 Tax=Janthinobacterium sp. HH102 TaxID=1537274 RepID=UPI0008745FE2|nr:DUF932 domain-containing protein [Janthinobacterium sp. HH102]QOU76451.1 hypothetical protein JAB4_059510 [Janthinobacterium sp. HH102]
MSRFATQTAYRGREPLTDEMMQRIAPSIFATEAHESRSERYTYIPTSTVVAALRAEGFQPFMVSQARTRSVEKKEHTKHMIRMRQANQFNADRGEEVNEIILINSHDGTSSYQIIPGVFRVVCTNGLVSGKGNRDVKIRHSGNVIDNVIEGAFRVVEEFALVDEHKEEMKSIVLDKQEQIIFARHALELRYETENKPAPITAEQILRPWRQNDVKTDLWTTFNVVQENMIKGGVPIRTEKFTRTKTREVKGIDQNVRLNRTLWSLAEEMKKLKNG